MDINNIVFIDHLPTLDLHGFTRDFAIIEINQFIKDNLKMQNEFIIIIHGKGSGIIRETCLKALSKNKFVKDYKIWYLNDGCMIVQLDKKYFN